MFLKTARQTVWEAELGRLELPTDLYDGSASASASATSSDQPLPLRYIKVVPLASHGPKFNLSIWHIALKGVSDKALISQVSQEYDEVRSCGGVRVS